MGIGVILALGVMIRSSASQAAPAAVAPEQAAREAAHARLVEGVDLLRKGQFAAALVRFDQAHALVPSPHIQYDRGLALVGLGRDADALEAFDAFLAAADRAPPGTREKAERQRLTLRARVATLELTTDLAGAEVTLDGRGRGATPLRRSLYLDPGLHEVAARNAATGAVATERIAAAPGQSLSVMLHLPAPSVSPALAPREARAEVATASAAAPQQTPADRQDHNRDRTAKGWLLSAAVVGGGLIGTGVIYGLLAKREADNLSNASKTGLTKRPPPEFDRSQESNGLRYQTIEIVCLVGGTAALAAGAVLYTVVRRTERRTAMAISGAPAVSRGFAGAGLQLSY